MRVNTRNVFNAWMSGRSEKKQNSVWTDGATIYSYSTPIIYKDNKGDLVFNTRKYSVTTSCQQGGLRVLCAQNNIDYIEKEDR